MYCYCRCQDFDGDELSHHRLNFPRSCGDESPNYNTYLFVSLLTNKSNDILTKELFRQCTLPHQSKIAMFSLN